MRRPDYLVETPDGLVPVEIKSTACPARGPYDNHLAQLMGYCLLVEDCLGKTVQEGILRYCDREVRGAFTAERREWVLGIIDDIREAQGGGAVSRSHNRAAPQARRKSGSHHAALCSLRCSIDEGEEAAL